MKKSAILFLSIFSLQCCFGQSEFEHFEKQLKESSDSARRRIYKYLYGDLVLSNPDSAIKIYLQYKSHFEKTGNKHGVAWMLCNMSFAFQTTGDNQQAASLGLKSLKMFEDIRDTFGIMNALNITAIAIGRNGDWQTALAYQKNIIELNRSFKDKRIDAVAHGNTGECFLQLNQPDSALSYLSVSFDYSSKENDAYDVAFDFRNYGTYYKQKKNYDLSLNYYKNSIAKFSELNDLFDIADVSNFTAEVYFQLQQNDSSIVYANHAIAISQQNNFSQYLMDGYNWLYKNFEQKSKSDSAFKYLKFSLAIKDSLFNEVRKREIQSMIFSEQLRQQEKEVENQKAMEERKLNLQYVLIAVGIVTFLILFFLLSRSIIVTERWISFFGILGLLIVFEFINLLIHPSLEKVTQHNLIFMLLALVAIASLLIPLHHRMEKWVKEKMTEKNKQIRLANAKKTIEKLEDKSAQVKYKDKNV